MALAALKIPMNGKAAKFDVKSETVTRVRTCAQPKAHDPRNASMDLYVDFNAQAKTTKQDEVRLFRLLGRLLEGAGVGIFIEEAHGAKGQVSFTSGLWHDKTWQREMCDLAIVSHSRAMQQTRLTMHQCKLERGKAYLRIDPDFRFKADLGQYDLLHYRPKIRSLGSVHFPEELLSSTNYSTIGSFGVFYKDKADNFDYAYCGARWLTPLSNKEKTQLSMPHVMSGIGVRFDTQFMELTATHGMNAFFDALAGLEIGAVVEKHSHQARYIGSLLRSAIPRVRPPDELIASIQGGLGDIGDTRDVAPYRLLLIDCDALREARAG